MLTVAVCFEASGKSSTRSPLSSRYSVMPSTDVLRVTPAGSVGAVAACTGVQTVETMASRSRSPKQRRLRFMESPHEAQRGVEDGPERPPDARAYSWSGALVHLKKHRRRRRSLRSSPSEAASVAHCTDLRLRARVRKE